MDDFHLVLEGVELLGKKVLATIIEAEGSFYKKEGAAMLFGENGTQVGMLSPGCLEMDLEKKAEEAWTNGKALTVQYDMSSETDDGWGQGYGCNSILTILLEPVDNKLTADLAKVKKLLEARIPVYLFKKIEAEIEYIFVPCEGEPFGWWQGEIPAVEGMESKNGIIPGTAIFQQFIQPKPRLIVFGAGADARPLVSLAAKTGFSVTVCDWREALCSSNYFPEAESLIIGFPRKIIKKLSLSHDDLIVIMTHHFERDREILKAVLAENVKYIGVLGPRERTKRLLRKNEIPSIIVSPVGISIGAKGSNEIAVSIAAQLIEVSRIPTRKGTGNLWTVPE